MFSIRKLFFFVLCFLTCLTYALEAKTSRLLVSIEPSASFSAEEFAKASSATIVNIDTRNPYKALQDVFLDEPFIVLSKHLTENDQAWGSTVLEHLSERCGYRYVVFKNEDLDEATKIANHLLMVNPKYTSELVQLTEEEATRLYSLLEKIDKVFVKHNIRYWAGRETLLGAITHGGLLPWDDYLHLYVLESDEKKVENAMIDFEEEGLVLHNYFKDFFKVCYVDGLPLEDHFNDSGTLPFTYPAANIFIMTLEKRHEISDVYVYRSLNFYFNWNHDRFAYSQIENIRRVSFGPVTLPIPGAPEPYLNRMFGTSQSPDLWKTHVIERLWDHRREYWDHQGAALVEIDNFKPAPWK